MFAYVSQLVEEGIFDKVEIYFLIVGHTHASIDQYFSVLSTKILKSDFIGSPLALAALFAKVDDGGLNPSGKMWKRQHQKLKAIPLGVRKLSLVFDLRSILKPVINKAVKYYSIPHCFQFEKYMGISTMQYKIFSTSAKWLPMRPETVAGKF